MSAGDITIGIDIELTEKAKQSMKDLNNMTKTLDRLRATTIDSTSAFSGFTKSIDIGGEIANLSAEIEHFNERLGMTPEQLENARKQAKAARDAMYILDTQTQMTARAYKSLSDMVSKSAMSGNIQDVYAVTRALKDMRVEGKNTTDTLNALYRGFSQAGPMVPVAAFREMYASFGNNNRAAMRFFQELQNIYTEGSKVGEMLKQFKELGPEGFKEATKSALAFEKRLAEVAEMQSITVAAMGRQGIALSQLSRDFFWVGLGTMFAVMSYQRLRSASLSAESALLSYQRSLMTVYDAQKELERLQQAGVTTGEQYARAIMSVKEAQLAVQIAEQRVRDTRLQSNLAMLQFAFGTVPTVMRAITSLIPSLIQLMVAYQTEATAATISTIKSQGLAAAWTMEAISVAGLTLQVWQLVAAVSALTFGIPLLIGLIQGASAANKSANDIAKLKQEMEELGLVMTETNSPPLWNMFGVFGASLDKASKDMKSFSSAASMQLEPQLGNIRASSAHNMVTVNVAGPFYIRDKNDIDAIGDGILSKLRSRGVSA